MVRQARQLSYLNFQIHYPILIMGGRVCPTIGFASPKNLCDQAQLHIKNFLLAKGSLLNSTYRLGLVDTLVTHANMKGLGLTPLFGDRRHGFMLPQLKTNKQNDPVRNFQFCQPAHNQPKSHIRFHKNGSTRNLHTYNDFGSVLVCRNIRAGVRSRRLYTMHTLSLNKRGRHIFLNKNNNLVRVFFYCLV